MRSEAAIADCKMLNFSLKSWIGRKKRWAYCMKVINTPTFTKPAKDCKPPYQNTTPMAAMLNNSTAG